MSTAVAHWPPDLPDRPDQQGYSEKTPNTRIEGNTEIGPPKIRRFSTAALTKMEVSYMLTLLETEILLTFFNDDIGGGSLVFMGFHPRTGEQVKCLMTEPKFSTSGGDIWFASFTLLVLVS